MRMRMTVSLEIPEGASRRDVLMYVDDAVRTWKGSLRPPGSYDTNDDGDPMFGLDADSVDVTCRGIV